MSLQDHLYSCPSIPEVLEKYIKELSATGNITDLVHANKWQSYLNRIEDKSYLKEVRVFFNETFSLLNKKYPQLKFIIEGRRKALISTEKKILYYENQGQSLDLIRDFFAFRIVIYGDSNENLIKDCYDITQDIIENGITKGFMPCNRLPLMGVESLEKHTNDYFSAFPYKQFVKDYICFKKSNGYESLHFVLVDTKGRHLEIQIKTLNMHANAELGKAGHDDYKEGKYDDFPLERKKIKIDGYVYHQGKIIDLAGVEYGLPVFQHHKF